MSFVKSFSSTLFASGLLTGNAAIWECRLRGETAPDTSPLTVGKPPLSLAPQPVAQALAQR